MAKTTRGIRITDLWEKKGAKTGRQFMFEVWDPKVRRYKSKCFDDKREGSEWAEWTQALFRTGAESATTVRMADVGPLYVETLVTGERCADHIRHCRRVVEEAVSAGISNLTDPALADKTARWLVNRKARRPGQKTAAKMAPRTRNHYLGTLRAIGNFVVKRRLMTYNPFLAVEPVKELRKIRPVYSLEELRTLIAAEHCGEPMWMFAVLAIYTGMRSKEISQARWSWIDWEGEIFRVPAEFNKTGTDRMIPLQPELGAILKPLAGVGAGRILDREWSKHIADQASSQFKEYLHKLGIERGGRIIHDLRHSCASLLAATGYPERLVMDAMGHEDRRTSDHYTRGAIVYYKQVKHWPKGEFRLRTVEKANDSNAMTSGVSGAM